MHELSGPTQLQASGALPAGNAWVLQSYRQRLRGWKRRETRACGDARPAASSHQEAHLLGSAVQQHHQLKETAGENVSRGDFSWLRSIASASSGSGRTLAHNVPHSTASRHHPGVQAGAAQFKHAYRPRRAAQIITGASTQPLARGERGHARLPALPGPTRAERQDTTVRHAAFPVRYCLPRRSLPSQCA